MTAYDPFIKAFTILSKYETYGQFAKSFDGYELLAGETAPDAMTPEDAKAMTDADWTWDEAQECWSHFID